MRLDLSNSGQIGDWLEVLDPGSIADQGERAQFITDLEAFARDPQARTLQGVLQSLGVTNSSRQTAHPASRTGDLRDSYGRPQVGHLDDAQYAALLEQVRRAAPRWLAEIRAQAAEAAKVARATMRGLATHPTVERELLVKAVGFEREADRALRVGLLAIAALEGGGRGGRTGKAALRSSSPPPPATGSGDIESGDMLYKATQVAYERMTGRPWPR